MALNNTGMLAAPWYRRPTLFKGSFYFYFKSKEDFGIALVEHFRKFISSLFEKRLNDKSRPPSNRLSGLIDNYIRIFKNLGFTHGCPNGNLSLEMSDLSEPIRSKLRNAYDAMRLLRRKTDAPHEGRHRGKIIESAKSRPSLRRG